MKTFEDWFDISKDFEGHCYIENYDVHLFLKKDKIYHRIDGPACINNINGCCEYWINGMQYTEKKYWDHPLMSENKLNQILEL